MKKFIREVVEKGWFILFVTLAGWCVIYLAVYGIPYVWSLLHK